MKALLFVLLSVLSLAGCESTYYSAMEKVGIHKRDILVDRIDEARDAQQEGQQQFKDALEEFRAVTEYQGGDLAELYDRLNAEYEDSMKAAEAISDRIESVENVAEALFEEWEAELDQYTSANLRRDSAQKLKQTRARYKTLMSTMRRAERSIDPVMNTLRDNVLYLKHNLNARAVNALKSELRSVDHNVQALVAAMSRAIEESDRFIETLR